MSNRILNFILLSSRFVNFKNDWIGYVMGRLIEIGRDWESREIGNL